MSEKIIAVLAILLAATATWFALKPDSEPEPVAAGQHAAIGIPVERDAQAVPSDNKEKAHALYTEGLRHFQAADYAKAREKWDEALKLDPAYPDPAAGLDRIKKITGK
ncbi:MAG: tetratricopeptide repeat protein [Elusimicrobiales bacterium]|nr:tetratricopeptide repeat protein [Elusimicrobiales bacterium]